MKQLCLLVCLYFACSLNAQVEYGRSVCKTLSDSAFHGRGYIKGGDSLAALWIANEFKQLGVKPLKKTYFQKFNFPVNTFPTDVHLTINGKELTLGKDYIPTENSGAFSGSWNFRKLSTSELFDKHTLIAIADSLLHKQYNAVVLNQSTLKGDSLKLFHAIANSLNDFGNVLTITSEKLTFSISNKQLKFARFTVVDSILPTQITSIHSDIKPLLVARHQTQNVIGFIPAKNKKAPYLFFTAHYDHLGAIGNQVYFPGASDNASGVAMLLSMAKYYTKNPPPFNLVFIAFAGEEAGLIGSDYYVNHPLIPLTKIRFLVNLDLMGNGEDGATIVNGSVFKEEFALLQAINQKQNYLPVIKERGKAANSDHYHFSEKGVPAFFIYTMGKNKNYHDIFDTYNDLSFAKFDEIVRLWIDFANNLK